MAPLDAVSNNPQATNESKSDRKKKPKAKAPVPSVPTKASSEAENAPASLEGKANGVEGVSENAYVKELQK